MSPNASRAHVASLGRCWHVNREGLSGDACRLEPWRHKNEPNLHGGSFAHPIMPWWDIEQPGAGAGGEGGAA